VAENYLSNAESDAKETVEYFFDTVVESLLDDGKASDDLYNDYPGGDAYHHESHVDKSYSLTEAAELLDELHDSEETDTGLWEGMMPKEAIGVQAAYTYGNAVYSEFRNLIEEINEAWEEQQINPEHTTARKRTERVVRAALEGARLDMPEGPKEWHPERKASAKKGRR
jgi:hypothetical protein